MSGSTCAVLIVAAGRGRRFGGEIPKQYRMLAGRPVLSHSLAVFSNHPSVSAVRVVIHPDDRELYDQAAAGFDILDPVQGGETRQDSVRLGLDSLADSAPDTVLIHDGARPFVTEDLITRTLTALEVAPGASQKEIRAAYRRLAARYHPDKVAHLGEEFQAMAERKFKAIQNAYDVLRQRG